MDKNTITGLVLIAILLVVFSFLSRPSKEEIAAQQRYYDSIAQVQQREADLRAKAEAALANEKEKQSLDSTSLFFNARKGTDTQITIQNDVAQISVSTKGGRISAATLKDWKEQDKTTPVTLFSGEDASMNFLFYNKKETIQTEDYYFTPVNQTDTAVTMRLAADSASYIDFIYTMHPESYLVDFKIQAVNMDGKLASSNKLVDIEWSQRARQIEKGYTYENRLAELTYKVTGESTDYLSPSKNDEKELSEPLDWIAFKNQFFSTVFLSESSFEKSKLTSKLEAQGSGYIKDYAAEMSTAFDPAGQTPTQLYFYFGPNHYKTLTALDKGRDDKWELNRLVYLGWPLIRWINKWFTINIFDWLSSWGLSMGLVLLFMTLIVKAVVFPATWKTYMSSAKMRVLKPKIDEINKKYPKQEDAMKKQQEIMGLYSQYGVSPMGGCLPMLIQFPILMALFLFVPSAIELRQQSFLWADDLSSYDSIVNLPFSIPFYGDHVSLFALLMAVSLFGYSWFNYQQTASSQPQMAGMKFMMVYMMPIMMLFWFNSYSSGLCYYYLLSNIFTIGQTLVIRRMVDDNKIHAIMQANAAKKSKGKKSKFQQRYEELMRQQEAQQRAKRK